MVIYQPMIDGILNQIAKTTPKAERKAIATAALCEAVEEYDGSQGDIKTYVEESLRRSLITENRKYTAAYRDLHPNAPLQSDGGAGTLYHLLADQYSGGISKAESRIMAEQFLDTLSRQERYLMQLMREEVKLPQIAMEMYLTQDEVIEMGRETGRKREEFYTVL